MVSHAKLCKLTLTEQYKPEKKKQDHYSLPPDLRWEGSSVYLFALITNYLNDVCTFNVTFRSP